MNKPGSCRGLFGIIFAKESAMALCETLQKATSEEDVKAAYIKALGLINVQRNLFDR